MQPRTEPFRMADWLILSVLAYLTATILAAIPAPTLADAHASLFPRLQTVLWKVGHLNLAAYIGYWVDRKAFRDRIYPGCPPLLMLRRALVMAACILGFGLAL